MLRANPASLQFVALGEALRSRGRYPEAAAALTRGLAIHPDLRSAQAVLARVYAHIGDHDEALQLLSRLVPEDPSNAALACLQIELLIAEGELAEAERTLNGLAVIVPQEPSLRRLRAQIHSRRQVARRGDPFVSHTLAERLEAARRFERALAIWDTLASLYQDPVASERAQRLRVATLPSLEEDDVSLGRGSRRSVERLQRWLDALDGVKREETR
jgi:tetratricopeptide (TPR) repeat protein